MPVPPVSVLGVDDWAWRKGQRYGTILVDLERRRVVDLLPDRSADTLAAWLKEHPGVSAVVRDRAGAYAEGAARGAPDAIQVADRWHLLRNSSDALRTVLDQHHRDLRAAARTAAQLPEPSVPEEPAVPEPGVPPEAERPMRAAERRSRAAQERRDARFAEVARLREQGLSLKAIARTIGVERKTVRRWLRAGHAPTWRHADRGTSILDPYRAYLEERWQAGCHNAAALWRDLKEQGFPGQSGRCARVGDPAPAAGPARRAGQHGWPAGGIQGRRTAHAAPGGSPADRSTRHAQTTPTAGSSPRCWSARPPSPPPSISSAAS